MRERCPDLVLLDAHDVLYELAALALSGRYAAIRSWRGFPLILISAGSVTTKDRFLPAD